MLNEVQLGNFKAFADTQRVPIRPLTLIYGANSAGKSSIIHSLVLAHHAIQTGELDVHRTTVGGESVDLGGFRQYVHRRDVTKRVEWAIELDARGFEGRLAELFAPVSAITVRLELGIAQEEKKRKREGIDARTGETVMVEEPTGEMVTVGDPYVQVFALDADGKRLLSMSRRPNATLQMDRLDHEHPVLREAIRAMVMLSSTTNDMATEDFEGLDDAVAEIVAEMVATCSRFLPDGLAKSDAFQVSLQQFYTISKGRRREDLAAAVRSFLPRKIDEMLKGVAAAVSGEIGRLQYLGPLRSYPPRHLAFAQHHDPNWHAGGGYAWDVVRRDGRVRTQVNEWLNSEERLQTPYMLEVQHSFSLRQLEPLLRRMGDDAVQFGVQDLLNRGINDLTLLLEDGVPVDDESHIYEIVEFADTLAAHVNTDETFEQWHLPSIQEELQKRESEALSELILMDQRTKTIVSHRDVGIGISQVLPVLVGAYAAEDKLVAIEQPEIHLHPKLQAELGDVFIDAALGARKNTFLIETHSEHLLLRIMKRMRQTFEDNLPSGLSPVRPEDISVLYVEPDGKRSIIREMPLNDRGELVKAWPGGFFEEGLREMF
jgi:predicted ATPase